MTSWVRSKTIPGLTRAKRDELDVRWRTSDRGFCAQFNNYFYSVNYAKRIGKGIEVQEFPNCISDSYPLLSSTFVTDISGVNFVNSVEGRIPPMLHVKVFDQNTRTPPATLQANAKEILKWNPALETQIQGILGTTGLPAGFDLGIHIRSGDKVATKEMKAISIDRYVREIEAYLASSGLKSLRIFVMSDNSEMLEQLKKRAKGPFNFYTIESKHAAGGHTQSEFNARPFDEKFNEYMVFLTELYIMQRIPALIVTLSSNVGKFLYLTAKYRTFKSLDVVNFVPL